jgi:hypothetical protein
VTQHRALTQAIRRRMALTGEKYTEARRALQRERSVALEGERATVLAEGEVGGWPWVLAARRPPAHWESDFVFTVDHRDRVGGSWSGVQLADLPVDPHFFRDRESDASVLCGPVADEVDTVLVERVFPVQGPTEQAPIYSAAGLGRFFAIAFEEAIEQADVHVEPAERFASSTRVAINMRVATRRQIAEGVDVGRGPTPNGGRWRLRVWRARPDELRVDLLTADNDAGIDAADQMGMTGAGYGGPPAATDQPVAWRMMGGGGGDTTARHIVGEITPNVERVAVRLDDGSELEAQLVRTDFVQNDYFVAFFPASQSVVALTARGEDDRMLGRQDVHKP